jgi:hypothetical protein
MSARREGAMTSAISVEDVERALRRLYLAPAGAAPGEGPGLRREDLKKAREMAALLGELARFDRTELLVDAAAGHAYVGLLAVELLGFERVVLVERDPRRLERTREAAARLPGHPAIEVRAGDVADRALWPERPAVVVALHACGAASDEILDAAAAAHARWLLLVPCCYARAVAFSATAEAMADATGIPRQAPVRRRYVETLVDAERTLRLEAAGYEVTLMHFVPPTVTPHNLMFRARRVGEPRRMAEAAAQLVRLRTPRPQ